MYITFALLWCNVDVTNAVIGGCTDVNAHNFNPNATLDIMNCQYCTDGKQNGDEEGVDCGGDEANCAPCDVCQTTYGCQKVWRGDASCDAVCDNVLCDFDYGDCVVGCTNPVAHNFNPNATISINNCELCDDLKLNGDEVGIDCGGSNLNCTACDTCDTLHTCPKGWRGDGICDDRCNNDDCDSDGRDCVIGCTNSTAHNYNPDAKFDDNSCLYCTDGIQNADEFAIDCGGSLCRSCVFGCQIEEAHNYVSHSDVDTHNCELCNDNRTNGDEEGIDCGGKNPLCDPCTHGCMDPDAHNFHVNATAHNATICEFCDDKTMNGDEWGIDCGGSHPDCDDCVWGCMNPDAHNFNPNATGHNDTTPCEFCTDGIRNADEIGIDCWSAHALCGECVPGCMHSFAHNFNPNATIEMLAEHTAEEDFYAIYFDDSVFVSFPTSTSLLPVCEHCGDGIMNGDELGIDCGGSNSHCIACIPGCMNRSAHNFDANATQHLREACDVCDDGVMNGDEEGVDCGGANWHCVECDFGCMNASAHNFDPNATTSTEWTCEYCDDGIVNGDEHGIDCDSANNPLCGVCIYGCMNPQAHNYLAVAIGPGRCATCTDKLMNADEEGVDCGGLNPSCSPCMSEGDDCGVRNSTTQVVQACEGALVCVKNYVSGGVNGTLCTKEDPWDACVCWRPWCSVRNASNFNPNPLMEHLFLDQNGSDLNVTGNWAWNDTDASSNSTAHGRRLRMTSVFVERRVNDGHAVRSAIKTVGTMTTPLTPMPTMTTTTQPQVQDLPSWDAFVDFVVPVDRMYSSERRVLNQMGGDNDADSSWTNGTNGTMDNDTIWLPMWNDTDWNDTMWNVTQEEEGQEREEVVEIVYFELCVFCDDGVQNGDEEGVDCGGSDPLCPPCDISCSHLYSHNYFFVPEGAPGYKEHCETCYDLITNGDEVALDCGGKCRRACETYCTRSVAHNLEYKAFNTTTMIEYCETCTDAVKNGDEEAVDCGGAKCDTACDECARQHDCAAWQRLNVQCDYNCMFPLCNWDNNGCESCTKQFGCRSEWIGDRICQLECNHDVCQNDKGDCDDCALNHGCHLEYRGNGTCDDVCNHAACNWDGEDCTFGCPDPIAHNFDPGAHNNDGTCATCVDGVKNWDEGGVDCGGENCRACAYGCPDPKAHNYKSTADVDDGSCMTCYDKTFNGDEEDVDCGGASCVPCIFGCMEERAHNFLPIAEFDDGSCQTCWDSILNGDEDGADCGGDNPLCRPCTGCTDSTAHNYVPHAVADDGSCMTCMDKKLNGDELVADCGGAKCLSCVFGCMASNAHNYAVEAHADNGSCLTCSDGIKNGDETAIDCGGSRCDECVGCMDAQAHDYFPPATKPGTCKTCFDNVKNGDEQNVDCGGTQCIPCKLGCVTPSAHNYNETIEIDDGSCETCTDHLLNGDEIATDCGGALCDECVRGCMNETAHNFQPSAELDDQSCMTCNDLAMNADEEDIDCGGNLCETCKYSSASGFIASEVAPGTVVDAQYLAELMGAVKMALVSTLSVDPTKVQVQVELETVETPDRRKLRPANTSTPRPNTPHPRAAPSIQDQQLIHDTHVHEDTIIMKEIGSDVADKRAHVGQWRKQAGERLDAQKRILLNRVHYIGSMRIGPNATSVGGKVHGRQLGTVQVLKTWYTIRDIVLADIPALESILENTENFKESFQESLTKSGFEVTVTQSDICGVAECEVCVPGEEQKCEQCAPGYVPNEEAQCARVEDRGWCSVANCAKCKNELSFRCAECRDGFALADGHCLDNSSKWHPEDGPWLRRDTACVPRYSLLTIQRGNTEECKDSCGNIERCAAFMGWSIANVSRCVLLWEVCGDSKVKGAEKVFVKFKPCTCEFGEPEEWDNGNGTCLADGAKVCKRCRLNFHLNENLECEANACVCKDGAPVAPWMCQVHGANECQVCDEGFTMTDGSCMSEQALEELRRKDDSDTSLIVLALCVPLALAIGIVTYCRKRVKLQISPTDEMRSTAWQESPDHTTTKVTEHVKSSQIAPQIETVKKR
eukprot:GEMP01000459.1.p1 GENE.GEMP01000459.1~~GEMP01000459.1.p1  ORF type:complete len:2024 (+),score=458.94 GEMP01000459.1:22-6093(+)